MPYGGMASKGLRPETAALFERLDALGLSQRALAAAMEIEENKVSKMRSGERQLKAAELLKAMEWLNQREAERMPRESDHAPTRSADAGETASVMRLDLSYAMGPGTDLDLAHVEGEPVEFDIAFLRTLTPSPPDRLRIVNGIGDSMMPTLHDREELIIDLNQTRLNMQDRIWAIALFGAGAVKRLRTIGAKRILVISDNPDVTDQEVDAEDIVIAGRLVGSIKRH